MNYSSNRLDDERQYSQSTIITTNQRQDNSLDGETPFVQKKLSIENANAPLLAAAVAPFAGNERKRGLTAATYYSECFLHGVQPLDADIAAAQAMKLYEKWWVKRSFKTQSTKRKYDEPTKTTIEAVSTKKSRMDDVNLLSDDESTINTRVNRGAHRDEHAHGPPIQEVSLAARYNANEISICKARILELLRNSSGDTKTPEFLSALDILRNSYASRGFDARWTGSGKSAQHEIDGVWMTLSKSEYDGCEGVSSFGDSMYRLGRLAFDMFLPTNLKCTIQTVFNTVSPRKEITGDYLPRIVCPTKLQKELFEAQSKRPTVRNYDIVTAITIVSGQDSKGEFPGCGHFNPHTELKRPIQALLTCTGYCIPDPEVQNRLTIWFTGGSLEVQDEHSDLLEWKQIFDQSIKPNRSLKEKARFVASKVILGAELQDDLSDDGTMRYSLKKTIGGHGSIFVDVLFSDDSLRIVQGHLGAIVVLSRVPLNEILQL